MKKVLLFIWFGDEKPPYIQWSLENFRKMNPGWEIRYIEYSTQQILYYKEQNDPILIEAVEQDDPKRHFSYIVDSYKWKYLCKHPDEFIIYCDLDCFPIAPFDNFIFSESWKNDERTPPWISGYGKFEHKCWGPAMMCYWSMEYDGKKTLASDMWCLCNNSGILFDHFIQFHKGSTFDYTLVLFDSMFINERFIDDYTQRNMDFHNMKLQLGDSFCLSKFTPIEHYCSRERNTLNLPNTYLDK